MVTSVVAHVWCLCFIVAQRPTGTHPCAAHVPCETGGPASRPDVGQLVNHGLGGGVARACGSAASASKQASKRCLDPLRGLPRIVFCGDGIHGENQICGGSAHTNLRMYVNALGCPMGLPATASDRNIDDQSWNTPSGQHVFDAARHRRSRDSPSTSPPPDYAFLQ